MARKRAELGKDCMAQLFVSFNHVLRTLSLSDYFDYRRGRFLFEKRRRRKEPLVTGRFILSKALLNHMKVRLKAKAKDVLST